MAHLLKIHLQLITYFISLQITPYCNLSAFCIHDNLDILVYCIFMSASRLLRDWNLHRKAARQRMTYEDCTSHTPRHQNCLTRVIFRLIYSHLTFARSDFLCWNTLNYLYLLICKRTARALWTSSRQFRLGVNWSDVRMPGLTIEEIWCRKHVGFNRA